MAGPLGWPVGFTAALAAFRGALRTVPPSMLSSPTTVRRLFQPVANNLGWPTLGLPSEVTIIAGAASGDDRLRGEWLIPGGQRSPPQRAERMLLWAHGGGFLFCSPGTHRRFLARIAVSSGVPIFCVDYRKPPEFCFPVPGDDVLAAYKALRELGCAEQIFLGGDSAGGNLALCAVDALTQLAAELEAEPLTDPLLASMPAGLVLLSPWVDLSENEGKSWSSAAGIDYIPAVHARVCAEIYAKGADLRDVKLSPGLRGALPSGAAGYPPVLLDYGGCEAFRDQIERLAAAMKAGNVELDVSVEEGMVHGYPFFDFLWDPLRTGSGPFDAYFARVAAFLRR